MTEFDQDDVNAKNDESLRMLARSLTLSQGQFSLILAHCNYRSLRQRLMEQLRERCPIEFRERVLDPSAKTIETTIQEELGDEPPPAVIICGLESVRDLDSVLLATNQGRDEFCKNFPFPLVLWGTDEVLRRLIRVGPDFESWAATPIEFEITTDELIHFIQETADEVFAKVLDAGAGIFLDNAALNLGTGSPLRAELESARHELQSRGVKLDPELEACLEFVLGRDADVSVEQSRQHYERSLVLWQNSPNLERRGCVLYSLGIWWRTYATRHRADYELACGREKDYFQQCVEVFEQTNRKDLLAKFINALGVTLQQLQQWDELEVVAKKALTLHQTYSDSFRLARAYGFLAEVHLAKFAWTEAKHLAEQALSILASAELTPSNSVSSEQSANLEWLRSYHQGWYLFSLARSQQGLGHTKEAIATLETATAETKPYYDPELYIRILEELRSLYFEQGAYLKAFEIKQERRSIEQQYGFRAFVGAGRLQPKQQVINPALAPVEAQRAPTQEITVSGRQQDVNRLVERIGRNDHKLTVIQGQSGVGKSSILQAGLIPALKQKAISTRDVIPILQQVYTDWMRELGKHLAEALVESGNLEFDLTPQPPSLAGKGESSSPLLAGEELGERSILDQLRKNSENNLLTVLIFDQFEEFFFVCKELSQRRPFYEFLRECLDIPYVKVILSLREDYLYYLLECNNRLVSLEVINNNILDKNILYYLGNFSVEDAKSVIQSLTEPTHFSLELPLIDALVQDLAGELGEVRPIELQVVGAQLQTEKITKLEQYREQGPKEKLVERFLEEVVKDCGPENEQIAKLVLYLLTDENNTRPLKTRADLELELDVSAEKLDLVLEIFVKSRLVFQVPALPVDRYQLVHDYLVAFVRQQQSARLVAELEKEREQRKLTEAKLNEVLKQQLEETRRGLVWKVTLGVIAGGLAIFLPLVLTSQNNIQLTSMSNKSQGLLRSERDLDALVESLKAGKRLQQWWSIGIKPETKMQVVTALQDVVYSIRERNSLEGYAASVTCVNFSPDGQRVVSGSEDGTLKLWSFDGEEIKTVKGHEKKITSISFSPNGQRVVSGSEDGILKVWSLDGKEIKTFKGHKESITSVTFNSNGQRVVSGSEDGILKVWSLDGKEIKTFPGHQLGVTSVSSSLDGKVIASGSKDKTVKLWDLNGQEIKTMNHESSVTSVSFSADSQTIVSFSRYGRLKIWRRDGTLLRSERMYIPIENRRYFPYPDLMSLSSDNQAAAMAVQGNNFIWVRSLNRQNWWDRDNILNLKGHRNNITAMSFSANGKVLASASEDKTVKLWNLNSRDFKVPDESRVTDVSFSPNGQIIASVSQGYDFSKSGYRNKVQLWQRGGTLRTTLPGLNSEVSFSHDNQMLVSASQDSTVQLWRRDGTFLKTLQGEPIDGSFSPDGRTIALIRSGNKVQLSESNGTPIKTLQGYTGKVYRIIFSPDGQTLATASEDRTIKLWRRNGTLISTLKGYADPTRKLAFISNTDQLTNMSFSPNGETLVIWGDDNTVRFLQRDGKEIRTLKADVMMSVRFSPDKEIVAIHRQDDGDTDKVDLWQTNGSFIKTLTPQEQSESSSVDVQGFTPDSQTIAISVDGKMQFWKRDGSLLSTFTQRDVKSFSPNFQTLVTFEGNNKVKLWKSDGIPIRTIQVKSERADLENIYSTPKFSPDGQTLAIQTNENTVEFWRIDGTFLKFFQGLTNREIDRLSNFSLNEHISFSSDSKIIAIRTDENIVQFWRINSKESPKVSPSKPIKGQGNWVRGVRFIPNSETVAIVGRDDTVKLWRLPHKLGKDAKLLQIFRGHNNQVTSVSISPDGQMIASASKDKTVKLWRRDGKLLHSFNRHTDKVNSVSFSPDGKLIASASDDKTVKLWRPDGTVIKSFEEHANGISSISFSPNGEMIASASKDKTVKLWNLNGKESKSLKNLDSEEDVISVRFSPDGQLIASASNNKVKLWSVDGTLLTTFERLGSKDVAFSPDGKAIAAAGNPNVAVWNFDLDELLKYGCDWARDYLKNNPKAKSDRHLCDGIGTQK